MDSLQWLWMQYADENTTYIQNNEKLENHECLRILENGF